ncbi:hypothetical protein Dsin_024601 [Dipteronia sinensis]|uniref:DUF1985 domain-containing protein n=1 Tax=Dipteronia sinensis TaxID=43782 RepID=A0AAE0DWE2_9ROSI|nr:hypothetical protein Dsin_024601 [Dipteronia sinensis]
MAKFSQREFCLVTGLQFGVMSDIFLKPYVATPDGIHVRYFENDENIRLTDVWAKFMAGGFGQPKDGLKMALVLIANIVLFGQDLRRKVTLWPFQLVKDLEAFNSFPWGSYVYMMTIHYLRQGFRSINEPLKHIAHYNLYGFPWALEIRAMEAFGSLIDLVGTNLGHRHPRLKNWRIFKRPHDFFGKFAKYEKEVTDRNVHLSEGPQFVPLNVELDDGKQQLDDDDDEDGNEEGNDSGNDGDQFKDIVKKDIKKEISAMKDRLNARLTSVEASLAQLVNQRRQNAAEVQGDFVGSPNVGRDGTVGKGVGEGDAMLTKALDRVMVLLEKGLLGGMVAMVGLIMTNVDLVVPLVGVMVYIVRGLLGVMIPIVNGFRLWSITFCSRRE